MTAAASSPAPAPTLARVPTAFFAAVLGIGGLATGWRTAADLWGVSRAIGDGLAIVAVLVWAVVAVLVAAKGATARPAARGEVLNPVAGGFSGLVGLATMVAALAVLPLVPLLGKGLAIAGLVAQASFAVWFVGRLWQGGRVAEATTPVLYLPTVGGAFVAAMALAALGIRDAAVMAFGVGFVSWLVIEAVMWQRLLTGPNLAVPLRATMGIHMAPPAVGLVAYTAATGGSLDVFALMLFGYALLQATITARLWGWLGEQPFGAPFWAYSFAVASLPTGAMRLAIAGSPTAGLLAPGLFAVGNLIIAWFVVRSIAMIAQGRYLPPLPQPPAAPPVPTPPAE